MSNNMFKVFMLLLAGIALVMVVIVLIEIIAHRKDSSIPRAKVRYMKKYKDGFIFMDSEDLYSACRILYITSDGVDYSESGINGKFERIWSL